MKRNADWILFISLSMCMIAVFGCASERGTAGKETGTITSIPHGATQQIQEPVRVPPLEAYQKAKSGKALLVCAYEDETICEVMHLEGAIFLQQLKAKLPTLPRDQEIIFYCA